MNNKVAAFTVSEKSISTGYACHITRPNPIAFIIEIKEIFEITNIKKIWSMSPENLPSGFATS